MLQFKAAQDAAAAKHAAAVADLQRMPAFLRLLALLVMQVRQELSGHLLCPSLCQLYQKQMRCCLPSAYRWYDPGHVQLLYPHLRCTRL